MLSIAQWFIKLTSVFLHEHLKQKTFLQHINIQSQRFQKTTVCKKSQFMKNFQVKKKRFIEINFFHKWHQHVQHPHSEETKANIVPTVN